MWAVSCELDRCMWVIVIFSWVGAVFVTSTESISAVESLTEVDDDDIAHIDP